MVNVGDVLGGVAAQRNRRIEQERLTRGVDLQERGLELGEQQFGFQQQQAEAAQEQDQLALGVQALEQGIANVTQSIAQGEEPFGVEPLKAAIANLESVSPEESRRLSFALEGALGGQTPTAAATVAGEAEVSQLGAILGRQPTEEERLRKSGVAPPAPPASPAIVKLLDEKDATDAALFAARSAGNVPEVERLQARSSALNGAIKQAQLENVAPGLITKTTRAQAEEKTIQAAAAVDISTSLLRLIEDRPGNLGLTGALKGLANVTLAQVVPQIFSEDRAVVESAIRTTRENLKKIIGDETRFSDKDREDVFALFPSTGVFDTDEEAQIKIKAVMTLFARKLVSASQVPEADIPVELTEFKLQDVLDAVRSNVISKEEGRKMAETLFADDLRALVGEQ